MNELKSIIKTLSAEQRELRNQCKTVNIVGERRMSAHQACRKHQSNRFELRHLFAAYAKIRGKEIPVPKKSYFYPGTVNKLVEKYKPKEVIEHA